MAAAMFEPASREGDSDRMAAAQVPVVSRRHRKVFAVALAALACVAIIAVIGVGDNAQEQSELLGASGHMGAAHTRDVLQQLLADAESAGSDINGAFSPARPVELEEKKAADPTSSKPCDASCKQRKKEIADRMKALRDQINHDFKAMTSFGHKAGYLPPPQSIKAQVMAGTLLSTKNEPVAPPPFSPSLTAKSGKSGSSDSSAPAAAPAAAAAKSDASDSSSDSDSSADAAPPKDPPALVAPDSSSATLSSSDSSDSSDDSSDDSSSDDSSSSKGSSKGSSTWAKAFAFMHNTDNPVVGDKASRADTGSSHHHSSGKKEDPLKEAESDKFLAGFEDPDSSDSDSSTKTKLHSTSSHSSSDSDDPDSPLDKGSDPLKSAETDKFLAGFLGGR